MRTSPVVFLVVSSLCACAERIEVPLPGEGGASAPAVESGGAGSTAGGGGEAGSGGAGGEGVGGGGAGGGGAGGEGAGGGGPDACPMEPVFPVCYEPCDCELVAEEMGAECAAQEFPTLGRAVVCTAAPNPGPETGYKECKPHDKTITCGGTTYAWYCCEP